jgi:hypothetical protein
MPDKVYPRKEYRQLLSGLIYHTGCNECLVVVSHGPLNVVEALLAADEQESGAENWYPKLISWLVNNLRCSLHGSAGEASGRTVLEELLASAGGTSMSRDADQERDVERFLAKCVRHRRVCAALDKTLIRAWSALYGLRVDVLTVDSKTGCVVHTVYGELQATRTVRLVRYEYEGDQVHFALVELGI